MIYSTYLPLIQANSVLTPKHQWNFNINATTTPNITDNTKQQMLELLIKLIRNLLSSNQVSATSLSVPSAQINSLNMFNYEKQIIIKLKEHNEFSLGIPDDRLKQLNEILAADHLEVEFYRDMSMGAKVLKIKSTNPNLEERKNDVSIPHLEQVLKKLSEYPFIEYIQPDYPVYPA